MNCAEAKIPLLFIDVFTPRLFSGNPAAVCLLEAWLPESLMQKIAAQNNVSETAFVVPHAAGHWDIRWFTPLTEVDLCGHATLAAAAALFWRAAPDAEQIEFHTRSGPLSVARKNHLYALDLPAIPARERVPVPAGLGADPLECWRSENSNIMAVFADESTVQNLNPDFEQLRELGRAGVIVTAPGSDCDFVSRFFAPACGINEDPATGSAHCMLIPYWSKRLDKIVLRAKQLSSRGGEMFCETRGQRVIVAGQAVRYSEGYLDLAGV